MRDAYQDVVDVSIALTSCDHLSENLQPPQPTGQPHQGVRSLLLACHGEESACAVVTPIRDRNLFGDFDALDPVSCVVSEELPSSINAACSSSVVNSSKASVVPAVSPDANRSRSKPRATARPRRATVRAAVSSIPVPVIDSVTGESQPPSASSRKPSVPGRPSRACEYNSKNSRSCGHSLRVAQVGPRLARIPRFVQGPLVCGSLPGLDRLSHREEQTLPRAEVVDEHPVTGAYGRGQLPEAQVHDPRRHRVGYRGVEQPLPRLTFGHGPLYHLVHVPTGTWRGKKSMGQLQVEAEGTTRAGPQIVWSLVSDANTYAKWGPWNDGGYRPPSDGPSRKGSVQWFRYGRRTTSVEEILQVEEPRPSSTRW